MFAVGSVLSTLLPLLPGAEGKVLTPTFPLVIIGLVWGLHAALRKDWRRTPGGCSTCPRSPAWAAWRPRCSTPAG